jgi:sialidase-1
MRSTIPLTFLLILLACSCAHAQNTDVFQSGTEGYHTFRIPAVVAAKDGTLLAFAEGRRGSRSDSGDIDLVMRRSTDGGETWGPLSVVWDDQANTCGNPCPLLDRSTGTIHLLMTHNLGTDHERAIIDQTSTSTRTVWTTTSNDNGTTWSPPREITATTKEPTWTWYATGPGNGIQLRGGEHAGRLVIPCDHIEAGTKKYYSHVIVSDDHGKTWTSAGSTPKDQVNECAVAELADGSLLLNMRNYDRSKRTRVLSRSSDGGATWSALNHHQSLPEPICQASMIALNDGEVLVFSNPASPDARVAMRVRQSTDGGKSWSSGTLLHEGPSAYSSLVALPLDAVGCLYECGENHPYERIRFERVSLKPENLPSP